MNQRRYTPLLLGLVLSAGLAAGPRAETAPPVFEQATAQLEAAARSLKTAIGGQERLAALGKAVTAHEIALRSFRQALRQLNAREAAAEGTLQSDRAQLEQLLGALQSLSRAPKSALMMYPGGPISAMRSAGMMSEISPILAERAANLKTALQELRELRAVQDTARVEIKGALATLQDLRAQTSDALRRRRARALPSRNALREQAEIAAQSANDLAELSGLLVADGTVHAAPLVTFGEARGLIPLPVAGEVTARFGDADPWGRAGFGLTFEAPAYAQVSAPWDGTIRFAGNLIDYGKVIILETEANTLIVLAGLGQTTRTPGETVLQGERLGDLGGPIPTSDEFLLEETTDRDEISGRKLYMEIRRDGEAVDPALWFDLANKEYGE